MPVRSRVTIEHEGKHGCASADPVNVSGQRTSEADQPVRSESAGSPSRRVAQVSYLGFVHGTMTALARMRPRDRGVIVQVGSALSERSIPLQSA